MLRHAQWRCSAAQAYDFKEFAHLYLSFKSVHTNMRQLPNHAKGDIEHGQGLFVAAENATVS